MKQLPILVMTAALATSITAVAMTDTQEEKPTGPEFEVFDLDNNGEISTHEAIRDPLLQSVFKDIDANGDHKLSRDEYEHYKDTQQKKPG